MAIEDHEIYERVKNLIPTTSGTATYPPETLEFSLEAARYWHSRLIPKPSLYLGTGDASTTAWTLPEDLVRVRRVEKPYGESPPSYASSGDWETHLGTAGAEIVFESAPGSGDVFGIHYSGIWEMSDLDDSDRTPLSYLACAWICMRRASAMSDTIDPIINADVISYGSKARAWMQLKDHFVTLYAQTTGQSADAVTEGRPPVAFGKAPTPTRRRYARWWWWTQVSEE